MEFLPNLFFLYTGAGKFSLRRLRRGVFLCASQVLSNAILGDGVGESKSFSNDAAQISAVVISFETRVRSFNGDSSIGFALWSSAHIQSKKN